MMLIRAAEYRPDIAAINSGFTDQLRNVLPSAQGYIAMPAWDGLTAALPQAPLGAFAVRALDQSVHVFGATAQHLYRLDHGDLGWRDVTRAADATSNAVSNAGVYHASEAAPWSFAVFGDHVIAVNQNDAPQVMRLGRDSRFRDLGGKPPRAGLVKIWGDFVCLLALADFPGRVHWSGINDCEFWSPGRNNCDYQDFADGGAVQGASEATNPLILLQSAIYAGTFVPGSDIVFSFHKVQDKCGAKSPRGIACRGALAFFADEGGFFQISADGRQLLAIGHEKVNRTVFARMAASSLAEMAAAIDPYHSRVYWAMDYNGSGTFNEMLVYDWVLQQWSLVDIDASSLVPFYTAGYTLEGLDAVSASLAGLPFALDSKAWQGGAPILGAFRNGRLGSLTAAAMEAVLTTQELAATDGAVRRLKRIVVLSDTDDYLVTVGARMRRTALEPLRWGRECAPSYQTGMVHARARARFHRLRLRIPAGASWSHVSGFDVKFEAAGWR